MKYRNYPKLAEVLSKRHIVYNETLDYIQQEEKAGNIFVIRPETPVTIGRVEKNREKLKLLYQQGYDTARKRGEALLEFLEK